MTGSHIKDDSIDTTHGCILYLEQITVSFDGFKALNDLNLYIDDGELRCIIGPNGAGKTTMMDVITGKTRPDHGTVFFGQNHLRLFYLFLFLVYILTNFPHTIQFLVYNLSHFCIDHLVNF